MAYTLEIKAVDNVTEVIQNINKSLIQQQQLVKGYTAPAVGLVKALGTAFMNFSKAAGITQIAKGVGGIYTAANNATTSLSRMLTPLSFITGFASVAGITRLAQKWTEFGRELIVTSTNLGISAGRLLKYQMGAEMAGVSSQALTGALEHLQGALQDALMGRDHGEISATLNTWGISFRKSSYEAENAADIMPKLFDKLKEMPNAYLRLKVAQDLFGASAAEMMPYILQGSAGFRKYNDIVKKYAAVQVSGLAESNRLREGLTQLSITFTALGYKMGNK